MEVTVPDKLSAFKAVALVVAGEMFAVYGEGAAIKYLQFAALNFFDCGVNSFLSAGCASLAEGRSEQRCWNSRGTNPARAFCRS